MQAIKEALIKTKGFPGNSFYHPSSATSSLILSVSNWTMTQDQVSELQASIKSKCTEKLKKTTPGYSPEEAMMWCQRILEIILFHPVAFI